MKKSRRTIIPPFGPSKGSGQKRDANTVFYRSARLFELDIQKRWAASISEVLLLEEDEKSLVWWERILGELDGQGQLVLSSHPPQPLIFPKCRLIIHLTFAPNFRIFCLF
jgi:hypothetical protein